MVMQPDLFSVDRDDASDGESGQSRSFNVHAVHQVPSRSLNGSAIAHDCSDMFMAKVVTIAGNERYFPVIYDFRDHKWKSPISGLKEVVEYYTEMEASNGQKKDPAD